MARLPVQDNSTGFEDNDHEDRIWIACRAFLDNKVGAPAVGLTIDLLAVMWWPTKTPFRYDPVELAARFKAVLPARGYTAKLLRKYEKFARVYFTVLPDGRWTPSPEFFCLNNPYAEAGENGGGGGHVS